MSLRPVRPISMPPDRSEDGRRVVRASEQDSRASAGTLVSTPAPGPSNAQAWAWWRWALTGLSALALALSGYLGWHSLSGNSVIGCDGSSPCDQVLRSRWSTIGGVLPVSGLAAGVYLAMLVASLALGPATEAPVRRLAWRALLVLAGAAAGSAVWFIIVQKWVIAAFCPYCLATHLTALLLGILIIWRAPRQLEENSTAVALPRPASEQDAGAAVTREGSQAISRRVPGSLAARVLPLVGLALAGIMAVCQVGITRPVPYRGGEAQVNPAAFDPHTVPVVGSPGAPYVVNLLFDYKCPHCQRLHFMLAETIRRYGGKLAFALCPTPLNPRCNPYVPRETDEFKDSCALAKVGLAVWVARHEAFAVFDQWMFSFESGDGWHPRSLEAAKAKAVELVGQANFDTAWKDPWIHWYLQASIGIFAATTRGGNGGVPQLVFGSRWVIPEPNDTQDLVLLLQNSLAVPKP